MKISASPVNGQRGQTLIWMAAAMVALLGLVALAVDSGHLYAERRNMQNAADAYRGWVVMSVERKRAGRNAVDMEYQLDAAHFRIVPKGDFVHERLVDEKVVLE